MVTCGCTSKQPVCAVGKQLNGEAVAVWEVIVHPFSFLSLTWQRREEIWGQYTAAVSAYLQHCGYDYPGTAAEEGGNFDGDA